MKQKDILFITISIFVVVVVWVASNIFHKWTTTTIGEELQIQLDPISPDFDTQTLEKLKSRTRIDPLYELDGEAARPASQPAQRVTESVPSPSPEI